MLDYKEFDVAIPQASPDTGGAAKAPALRAKIAIVLLAIALGASGVGWIRSVNEVSRWERAQKTRAQAVGSIPLAVSHIELFNMTRDRKILGGLSGNRFNAAETRYVSFQISGPNQSFPTNDLSGTLYVDYLQPDWSLFRFKDSPPEHTLSCALRISAGQATWTADSGLGADTVNVFREGVWHIRLIYNGQEIAEKSFVVQ